MRNYKTSVTTLMAVFMILAIQLQTADAQSTFPAPAETNVSERAELDGQDKKPEATKTAPHEAAADNSSDAKAVAPTSRQGGIEGFFRRTEISGFIDGYFSFNFNQPATRNNLFRNFDTRSSRPELNLAELVLEKRVDAKEGRLGFRLDLDYGMTTDLVHSFDPNRHRANKILQQAYVSYLAPIGSGLQVDVGKFVSWHGAEVIETQDNWNYSRGLLFALAAPAYHTGVRARYTFNSKVSLMGAVVNGWNNTKDNNGGKTFGLSLSLNPNSKLSIIQSYLVGPEQFRDSRNIRHLFDTIVTYKLNSKVALMGNYEYGQDSVTGSGKVSWQGVAGYLRYSPTQRFAFIPRVEWFSDPNGFSTGTVQSIKEVTLTGEYQISKSITTKVEFRNDWSSRPIFPTRNPAIFAQTQPTVLAGLIWKFSYPAK